MDAVLEILAEANGLNTPKPWAIVRAEIARAEGPCSLCADKPRVFEGEFAERDGNAYLKEISTTAPRGGCYDKTDVKIYFSDGQTVQEWEARFDVKHFSEPDNDTDLRGHVRDFLFHHLHPESIGWIQEELRSISSVKRARGKEHLDNMKKLLKPEDRKAYSEFLSGITGGKEN